MPGTAFGRLTASQYNKDTQKIVARGRRTSTTSNSTGTEVPDLRVDNISVYAGYAYMIWCTPLLLSSGTANDQISVFLRISEDGTVATTADTQLAQTQGYVANTTHPPFWPLQSPYFPATDLTLSVLLSHQRTGGGGSCNITAAAGINIDLVITQIGIDPGDTGVDL